MIPYLLVFSFFAYNSLSGAKRWSRTTYTYLIIFFTLFIGFRVEVGGDWGNYVRDLNLQVGMPFPPLFEPNAYGKALASTAEPGAFILKWIGANIFGGIYFVNVVCGLIFSICLINFCREQPKPWLSLLVAIPYLVIVVAMGYTRQSIALGFEMVALMALKKDKLIPFLIYIAIASTFHRTILVVLLLPALTVSPSLKFDKFIRIVFLAIASYGLYLTVFAPVLTRFLDYYTDMESQGAQVRVLLCLVPSLLYLLTRKKFEISRLEGQIWNLLSISSIVCAIALFLGAPSTMIDRLALYLIPLQILIASHLPFTKIGGASNKLITQFIVLYSLAILLVWLFFADYSVYWLPYRSLLIPI